MPSILYGSRAYRRDNGNLPEIRLVNMFMEASPSSENQAVLLSRKGLAEYASCGEGPIRGVFVQQNVFDNDVFCVSGDTLYRNGDAIGVVSGDGPVSFASGASDELAVCAGEDIHRYDGDTFVTVPFPDATFVSAIAFSNGLYLAIVRDSDKWYWSAVLDADVWEELNFASAESSPDVLRDIKVIGDALFLMGAETIERWSNTGNVDAPYTRIEGAIIEKGVIATGVSVELDNTVFFVSNEGIAYRLAEVPQRISDNGIEERIKDSASLSAFGFTYEGHPFFALRLDTKTFLFDVSTNQWCEFATYGETNWRARTACQANDQVVFGDAYDGSLWVFDGWKDADAPLERLFTAVFPLAGGVALVTNLMLEANVGWTDFISGQGSQPVVEMRASRDAGATWGTWRVSRLGEQGRYRTRSRWTRCGMFDTPGGMFEIRVTDPVPFRVSNVTINEAGGGRSR